LPLGLKERSEMFRREIRLYTDYKQAVALLRDNHLVWSSDFDGIRLDLADLIDSCSSTFPPSLTEIVQTLISSENDLSIGN
jgi:hypothetical protein